VSVERPDISNACFTAKLDAVRLLVQHAQRDVIDDTWKQYVEAYVASLKKTPEEAVGCRSCGSRNIAFSTVDERRMYECVGCGWVWYEQRRTTSPMLTIFDDITEGVEKNGLHK
jgi:hypothetical protein